jgi:hypothetical protein
MAHGFLTPQAVKTRRSPLQDELYKQLGNLGKELLKQVAKRFKILEVPIRVIEKDTAKLTGRDQKALPPAATRMLGGTAPKGLLKPSGGLATRDGGLVGKNPTDIDIKTGKRLPPGGPRLPGTAAPSSSASGPRKGGTFTDFGSAAAKPLSAENFFAKAVNQGIDANTGEYLSKEQRIAAFQKGKVSRNVDSGGAPPIVPDSGADIVAAVNRNTQMIVSLVDATKEQTKNDSNLVQKQITAQETMASRAAARAEEKSLEQGSDLSGFMTPENFAKKKQQEAKKETGSKLKELIRGPNPFKQPECGCGIGGGFEMPTGRGRRSPAGKPRVTTGRGGLPIPDFVEPKARMPGGVFRRGGQRALTRGAAMVGGKAAAKGVAKGLGKMGLKKIPGVGAVAGAAFAAERAMKGDWLGAGGELLSGLASTIPGVGTAVSAGIDAGLMARDAGLTPFARGGIITQPTQGLVGEAGQEGVFPLEGSRGKKTFQMFGEGIMEAQKRAKQEFADLQALGLKEYFQVKGGFKLFGNVFKMMLGPLLGNLAGGIIDSLGSFANNVFGVNNGGGGGGGGVGNTAGLADFIGGLESGNDYTKMVGGAQDASVLGKTIDELDKEKGGQFAMGRYQIQMRTAKDVLRGAGIDSSTFKFDQAGQDKIFELLLKRRGIDDFMSGKLSKEDFAKNLSKEWAALPQDASGKGYWDKVGTNKSLTSFSSVMGQLDQLKASGTPFKGSGGGGGNLAAAAQSLKGMSTSDGPDGGKNGCVYAVNKVFKRAGITPPWGSSLYVPDAEKSMINAGWQQVPYNQMQPGDVFVMKDRKSPPQAHIGVATSNKMILSNSSGKAKMSWEATAQGYNAYYGGQGTLYRMPGSQAISTANATPPGTPPPTKPDRSKFTGRSGAKAYQGAMEKYNTAMEAYNSQQAAPGPVAAAPANANNGVPMMTTSAQIAMGQMAPAGGAPTVINNYYTQTGGGGSQVGFPNSAFAANGMDSTGTALFQQLRLATS